MGAVPDWSERLGAVPEADTEVAWSQWTDSVATFSAEFQALGPRLSGEEREDPQRWNEEAGKVMLRPADGSSRSFVEAEVVKAFRAAGWDARWTDAFGAARPWMTPWKRVEGRIPQSVSSVLRSIEKAASKGQPWDILAWRDDDIAFVECKAPGEDFTDAELAFIWGAAKKGIPMSSFAVLRGDIHYPDED